MLVASNQTLSGFNSEDDWGIRRFAFELKKVGGKSEEGTCFQIRRSKLPSGNFL